MELLACGVKSDGEVAKCKYKLRSVRRGEDGEDGPRKRGPKPRLRSAGMSRSLDWRHDFLSNVLFNLLFFFTFTVNFPCLPLC